MIRSSSYVGEPGCHKRQTFMCVSGGYGEREGFRQTTIGG